MSELLKQRYNQGLACNLYFWRNNVGDEIDVVAEEGKKLQPIEIKSSQTFSTNFLTGINKWMQIAQSVSLKPQVVHGGNENMRRNGVEVKSWKNLKL